jgi:ABC-2 type transport system permease protein
MRYEWVRLTTTRGFHVLTAATILVSVLVSWAMSLMISNMAPEMTAQAAGEAATLAATRSPLVLLAAGLLGIFSFGQEKRYGTLPLVLLAIPQRGTLFAAKLAMTLWVTTIWTTASMVMSVIVSNVVLSSRNLLECDPPVLIGCLVLANGWALLGIGVGLLLPRAGAVAFLIAGSALVEPLLGQLVERLELWGTSAAAFLPFRAGASLISFADPALATIVAETAPRLPAIGGGTVFFLYVALLLGAGYRKGLLKAH